jgi:hypothetical protein
MRMYRDFLESSSSGTPVQIRAGQIEAWGRGIERIFSARASAGIPPPTLRCEQKGLWIDFEFGPAADLLSQEAGEKTGEKAREKTRDKILGLIRVDPGISMESGYECDRRRLSAPVKHPVGTRS